MAATNPSTLEDFTEILEACVLDGIYEEDSQSKFKFKTKDNPMLTPSDVEHVAGYFKFENSLKALFCPFLMVSSLIGGVNIENQVKTLFSESFCDDSPSEIDFPKFLTRLQRLFPDPMDPFDFERAFAVLDDNKNGTVIMQALLNTD